MLKRLCLHSKVAKALALRELLERSLFRNDSEHFGSKNSHRTFSIDGNTTLLKQNKSIVSGVTLLEIELIKLFSEQDDSSNETFFSFQRRHYRVGEEKSVDNGKSAGKLCEK